MTVTVYDDESEVEINLGESEVGGAVHVIATVYARKRETLLAVAVALKLEYGEVEFSEPCECADERWGMFGRIG